MSNDHEAVELYRRYRPERFKDVVGQRDAMKALADMGKRNAIPHALLFTGPSGTGKTTLARIIRNNLKCSDVDFVEINASDFRGVDTIRDIRRQMGSSPIAGNCRVWLIDEVHQLTNDAQNAFLKILEDTPSHVYFMLATTDPQKLKKTIVTRCTEIRCKSLSEKDLIDLVKVTSYQENVQNPNYDGLDDAVAKKIAQAADGSARKALVLLHAVIGLDDKNKQMAAIDSADSNAAAIEIARMLMRRAKWSEVSAMIKKVDDEPETIRRIILGYFSTVLLGGGDARAAEIIEEFRDNWYDCGKAGLVVSCYHVTAK